MSVMGSHKLRQGFPTDDIEIDPGDCDVVDVGEVCKSDQSVIEDRWPLEELDGDVQRSSGSL